MNILLVMDDPILSEEIISDIREFFPIGKLTIIDHADSFDAAIELLPKQQPQIAIVDIELQGDENARSRFAQYIKQTEPIPVIFLTGLQKDSSFDFKQFTAPVGTLWKPFRKEELIDKLELLMVWWNSFTSAKYDNSGSLLNQKPTVIVTSIFGESSTFNLEDLILLITNEKIISAYFIDREEPVEFFAPSLKEFFAKNLEEYGSFYMIHKYAINLGLVLQIMDNYIYLPRFFNDPQKRKFFKIPIPQGGKKRGK